MANRKDITGKRIGRLVVLSDSGERSKGSVIWLCQCDCGNTTKVSSANISPNRKHKTTSCGCYSREQSSLRNSTHRMTGKPTYRIWHGMRTRCNNPNDHTWPRYGGRGIKVCERWYSFENFLADMGERPDGMTLDRIDNDGHYSPDNCRWASKEQQDNNKSVNVFVTWRGKRQTLSQWSRELAINISTLWLRYSRYGDRPPRLFRRPRSNASGTPLEGPSGRN